LGDSKVKVDSHLLCWRRRLRQCIQNERNDIEQTFSPDVICFIFYSREVPNSGWFMDALWQSHSRMARKGKTKQSRRWLICIDADCRIAFSHWKHKLILVCVEWDLGQVEN
jgi:hypothetical protein